MNHIRFYIILVFLTITVAASQNIEVRGAITYIAGEAVYTSLGRNDGILDSMQMTVLFKYDTIATLKVFATSSKSSVCRVLQAQRRLAIGDSVSARVEKITIDTTVGRFPRMVDTTSQFQRIVDTTQPLIDLSKENLILLKGRITAQYYTTSYSTMNQTITQPGVVVNLKGKLKDSPYSFDLYGNFRALVTGSQSPFAKNGKSLTRLYRLSVDYDDSIYLVSLGRIISTYSPSLGYIDGILMARRIDGFTVGITGGFQPDYAQRSLSSEYKKFSFFGNFQSLSGLRQYITLAYSRTYFHTSLDREAVSLSYNGSFTNSVSFSALSEIDLREKSHSDFQYQPHITSLFSHVTYRLSPIVTAGIGYSVWRPNYSFSSIRFVPDSMLDKTTRGNLSTTITLSLPYGISVYNTYSPRSSNQAFGKEFSNYSSVSFSNLLNQGISIRTSFNINSTIYSKSRGYGAMAQRSFGRLADVTARYQFYSHELTMYSNTLHSHSFGIDFMSLFHEHLTFWGSIERMLGSTTEGYRFTSELSWRF